MSDTAPSTSGSVRAKGLAVGFAALATLALATVHETREGANAMLASDVALAAKNPDLAIAEAFSAATHVAPFSPYAREGHARLRQIAEDAENRGDDELALTAWRAIRAAEVATKSPFSGDAARRKHAEAAIARIDARRMLVLGAKSPGFVRFDEGELAKRHGRDPTPAPFTFLVLGAAAVAFATASGALARRGFGLRGRPSWIAAAVVGVSVAGAAFALAR